MVAPALHLLRRWSAHLQFAIGSPDYRQSDDLVQIPAVPPKQRELQEKQLLPPTAPPLDKAAVENPPNDGCRSQYGNARADESAVWGSFPATRLAANLQEKVIDILTQQLEQQASEFRAYSLLIRGKRFKEPFHDLTPFLRVSSGLYRA